MEEFDVPESHPRYESLRTRHLIEAGIDRGLTSRAGLIAHGRGEAFDYLLGEETIESAATAERAGAAHLLRADHPVLSVNGNAAALVPAKLVELAAVTGAALEVNLFHRTAERIQAITDYLREHGATDVLGRAADATIPGLDHDRGLVDADGIYAADVVLVPLEDGDRAAALAEMGKVEIVIDLNPLSRSARVADVPIVDNIVRAVPAMIDHTRDLAGAERSTLDRRQHRSGHPGDDRPRSGPRRRRALDARSDRRGLRRRGDAARRRESAPRGSRKRHCGGSCRSRRVRVEASDRPTRGSTATRGCS